MSINSNITKIETNHTTSDKLITESESDKIVFKSSLMKNYKKRNSGILSNFDDLEAENDNEFKEIKDYFIMKPIDDLKLHETICISKLSELNMLHDYEVKTKLYSAVILDNKDKIVQIKNNKINLENIYKANHIHIKMEQTLQTLCDELISISETFEREIIDKISSERTNSEQIQKMQLFISTILDSNNVPKMKNIGQNLELKIKYIKLAYFLLHYEGFYSNVTNYEGLSESLKLHLTKIISLRNTLVINFTEWIKFIVGDLFGFVHQLEGLKIDESFLENLEIEYGSEKIVYKEKIIEKIVEKPVEKIVYVDKIVENIVTKEVVSTQEDVSFYFNFLLNFKFFRLYEVLGLKIKSLN